MKWHAPVSAWAGPPRNSRRNRAGLSEMLDQFKAQIVEEVIS